MQVKMEKLFSHVFPTNTTTTKNSKQQSANSSNSDINDKRNEIMTSISHQGATGPSPTASKITKETARKKRYVAKEANCKRNKKEGLKRRSAKDMTRLTGLPSIWCAVARKIVGNEPVVCLWVVGACSGEWVRACPYCYV